MKKITIYLVLLVSLVFFVFAQQPTLISLQGKLTNSSTGARIVSADLRVNINDSSGIVFNQNYSNAVSNGIFDLVLGSTYQLNLSYNKEYNLTLFVNNNSQLGEPFTFRGGQGQVGAGDMATTESYIFGNVSVTGNVSIGSNMSVDSGTFFVDAENNRVGIGNTLPNNTLEVSGDVNITGTLWAGTLNITGVSFTGGDVDAAGSLRVAGGANISGDLTVLGNIYGEIPDGFKIGNYSSEYGASGFDNENFTARLVLGNNSLWNRSGNDIFNSDFGGNVGIGTITPSEKLVVIGNISVPGTLFIDNESGRVGIGATSPNVTFHVSGSANITGTLSVGSFEMSNAGAGTMNVSGQTTLAYTAGNVGIGNENPNVTLDVSGDANITGYLEVGSGLNVSNGMNVLTGNVGIGTTSPNATLHVEGDINVTGGNDVCIDGGNCLSTLTGDATYAKRRHVINGSNLTGSSGDVDRGYTLNNTAITQNEVVVVDNSFLISSVDYTIAHQPSSSTITFKNVVYDSQNIMVDFQERTSSAALTFVFAPFTGANAGGADGVTNRSIQLSNTKLVQMETINVDNLFLIRNVDYAINFTKTSNTNITFINPLWNSQNINVRYWQ